MSTILKQDNNGIKPLLNKGELGYDAYTAGGDEGRVWVGTGTQNIALAIKNEVDLKADIDSPTFTGTVVLPSNTSIGDIDSSVIGYLDGVTNNIQEQLDLKANSASPILTGTPTAPTAAVGTSTTQIATTAYVNAEIATDAVVKTSGTGSAKLPVGTTSQRDSTPQAGMIRYNSETLGFEGYSNGMWQPVGGGQMLGQALVKAVSYNAQTIGENITVPAGLNAYSVGDITIENGYTVTVENGSIYKIL